jgi:HAD superfamily hydrolase (TIGR01493 family)
MELNSGNTAFERAKFTPVTMTNSSSGASPSLQKTGAASLDFDRFKVITFDCYGTLIDWETGLLGAIRPILRAHNVSLSDAQILQIYGELEPKAQNPYRRYRDVLASIVRDFGDRLRFPVSDAEAQSLAESLKNWLPFPDTNDALESSRRNTSWRSSRTRTTICLPKRHAISKLSLTKWSRRSRQRPTNLHPRRLSLLCGGWAYQVSKCCMPDRVFIMMFSPRSC